MVEQVTLKPVKESEIEGNQNYAIIQNLSRGENGDIDHLNEQYMALQDGKIIVIHKDQGRLEEMLLGVRKVQEGIHKDMSKHDELVVQIGTDNYFVPEYQ